MYNNILKLSQCNTMSINRLNSGDESENLSVEEGVRRILGLANDSSEAEVRVARIARYNLDEDASDEEISKAVEAAVIKQRREYYDLPNNVSDEEVMRQHRAECAFNRDFHGIE